MSGDDLKLRREELYRLQDNINSSLINIKTTAYGSEEYKKYFAAASAVMRILYNARHLLEEGYWSAITKVDFGEPDLKHVQLFAYPEYKSETPSNEQTMILDKLAPAINDFRNTTVEYEARFGNQLNQIKNINRSTSEYLHARIREILARNPQWASPNDLQLYGLQVSADGDSKLIAAQQRAILKSYKNALGWTKAILQWPTILLTLIVTVATGGVGGVASFMIAAVRATQTAVEGTTTNLREPQLVNLFHRTILGIAASLGIFLFAGSGLLVLTAQSGKALTSGSIELSPYFVAFLAFISGFLADDAFVRLTKAGQALFQTEKQQRKTTRKSGGG